MKKKIKIKYSNIFLIIVFVYIIVLVVLYVIGYFTKYETLKKEEIELSFRTTGVVVLKESVLKSDSDGNINYYIEDNKKVARNKTICTLNISDKTQIHDEIEILKKDIEKLKNENNNIKSSILKNKKEQLKILERYKNSYCIDYKSSISGIVSFKYDNYFEKIKIENLENINFEKIENKFLKAKDSGADIKKGEFLFRIIEPDKLYLYIIDEKKVLENGQAVEIVFKNNKINGNVEKIYQNNGKNTALVKIIQQNNDIYSTRISQFDIIYKKINGFKIPISCIKEKNKKLGVYVVDEETKMPKFKQLNKIYNIDEKYLYVDYNKVKNKKNNLKLYDRILLYPNFINQNIKVSR